MLRVEASGRILRESGMKTTQTVCRWIGVLCLFAGVAWGGTVTVTPSSKTYLQTELTVGTPVSLPITLQGWGATNLTVSASGGGTVFSSVVTPLGAMPQTTERTLYLYPLGGAGSTTVTVTVTASGLDPVSTSVSLTVTPIPLLNGLQATATFNEDTVYSDAFSVTYWGSSSALTWTASIQTGGDVLQSAVISGAGLSRTLTITPKSNKNGTASVYVSVADGAHTASQTVDVTVTAIPDAPQVAGLSATMNLQEDVSTQLVFTVTDLDDGDSGPISSTAAVAGGATSLFATVSIEATTLHLVPHDDAYGWCTVRVVTANSFLATTNSIRVNVRPVADVPVISSWLTGPLELDVGGLKIASLFPSVSVTDDDHEAYRNGTSNEYLKATVAIDNQTLLFASGTGTSTTNLSAGSVPAAVTAWLRSLSLYPPESTYAPVGTAITNTLSLRVYGFGSNDMLSVTSTVPVILTNRNHPPTFIPSVNPSTMQEGQTLTPFEISNVNDLDAIHTAFTLVLSVRPEDAALAVLSTPGSLYGNASELNTQLRNVGITAMSGVLTTPSTNITVRYVLSDSIDSVTNEVTLAINQAATAPVINGIDELTAYYTVSDIETVIPFPTVITYDVDQGGQQMLRADFSVSAPSLGALTVDGAATSSFSLQSQTALQTLLRSLRFEPVPGALAIGSSAEVVLVLTVTDATGLATVNSLTRVFITAVNKPPRVTVPLMQPLLLPPDAEARPFAGILVTNDDTHAVTMTLTLDDDAKGTLGNLGGFSHTGGEYTMSGTLDAINASLTNMIYTLNPLYVFPPDNPGGTLFTLTVEDYQVKLGQAQLWVQIQSAPRNHLVTRTANDGAPGSLLFAVAHAGNNDVITFALPEYPAVIRVPAAFGPMVLAASLTLKGPGADLLTISGDSDGDGDADTQLFVVQAHAVFEGLTLARGTAAFGGAVSVAQSGSFVLRACAIVDCEAAEYGGAIDVEGSLRVEKCYFAGNRVAAMSGGGGGAISFYSPHDSVIANTTFASNRVVDAGGYGGGAVYVERLNDASMNLSVTHCTFAGNADASGHASAVFVVGGNSFATLKNTVLSDYSEADSARNIDVTGDGWIVSEGGNVCDDSTRTALMQGGGLSVYLLTHVSDQTDVEPGLGALSQESGDSTPFFPLQINSPALGRAQSSDMAVDQRERMRRTVPSDAGAVQHDAAERVAITEIQVSVGAGESDPFIEVYVPRDGFETDLSGFTLYVNGVAAHTFGQGDLALTNSVYPTLVPATDIPASYRLRPGCGVVVVFPKGAVADFDGFSPLNPTPVVRGSQVSDAAAFAQLLSPYGQGTVMIARSAAASPIVGHAFQTVFIDPEAVSGTSRLDTAQNAIALAPQGRGFAFLPHSSVSAEMLRGWRGRPVVTASAILLQSPGATVDGIPFGVLNATPVAVDDAVTVTEDEIGFFFVLENDLDADNDPIILVDVSTGPGPDAGDAAAAISSLGADVTVAPAATPFRGTHLIYDPRQVAVLQALPVGVEILDTFCYEIIDMGAARVDGIPGGTISNTWITAVNHRLQTGASVVLSDASVPAYNGTFTVVVIDEDRFAIPVPFAGVPDEPGAWQTDGPRVPSARSEAVVTVKVTGVNDAPVVTGDVFTNVLEGTSVRIMSRPELAGAVLSLSGDPVPVPLPHPENLIANDTDPDSDDTWQTLRVVGVFGSVNAITDYAGTPGSAPVAVTVPAHGLTSGTRILIANYGGHPSYNGYHTVTVLDENTLTLPILFAGNDAAKGVWVILDEDNRYHAFTDAGATAMLTLRADPREDHVIYDTAGSSFLEGLAEGELFTDRFYQAVEDRHGAIGIGPLDVVVCGVNDRPVVLPDPVGLDVLEPLITPATPLAAVLADGLDLLYSLPPVSGMSGRVDVQALDLSGTLQGMLVVPDLWVTDEDTPILLAASDLLTNDSDIDRLDQLVVAEVGPFSRMGAALALAGGLITYDPSAGAALQALSREEQAIDTFEAVVTDHRTGGTVTSLVAVLVVGRNDTPVARPDSIALTEDEAVVFNPILHPAATPALHDSDIDRDGHQPDDLLTLIASSNMTTAGEARVDLLPLEARYDATVSELLNQLADWQSYTDTFDYTLTDNSFLFVVEDAFYVPSNTVGRVLDVLANDRDLTPMPTPLTIVEAGPTLNGGTVSIAEGGQYLIYDSPIGAVGDDSFRYVVESGAGLRRSARVQVRSVVPSLNGILSAADDVYVVAYGETAVLDVLANDNMLPEGGASLSLSPAVLWSSQPGQPVLSGNRFLFTATNGMDVLRFAYTVHAGGPSVASADVTVQVIDRRGMLDVQDDTFSVATDSASNTLDVLANDVLVTGTGEALRIAALLQPPAFGAAVLNASETSVVYTPGPGFIGIEHITYLATDRMGGTGTGVVSVVVGKPDTVVDFFTVEATTNEVVIPLDVLANDRVHPFPGGAMTLMSVEPADAAIGSMQVNGNGALLAFAPSNVLGQVDYDYVAADATGRSVTGRVTVATVAAGLYANTDRFVVRGGGTGYPLDVLANDRSYPDVNKTYSILSVGGGEGAPSAGGSVSVDGNLLSYTPAPGFFGQESFTYLMSDSVATRSAWVTVTVSRGDLFANADRFSVFYELESGGTVARAFSLPVVPNDRIHPALGQTIQISGLGTGVHAPDVSGEVSVAADGVTLIYRPGTMPAPVYVERFAYEITDGTERRASAVVEVEVRNRAGALDVRMGDDAFTVARNSQENSLDVLRNDGVLPGSSAGWSVTGVTASAYGGTVAVDGMGVLYTPPENFVGEDTFLYDVNDGLGGTGRACVRVRVGALPTLPDTFAVLSGSAENEFDVVANDALDDAYTDEYALADVFGASSGGWVGLSPSNTVLYTPAASYAGSYPYTESFLYVVADDAAGSVTGCVSVTVYERGSDCSTTSVTVHVAGRNDIPVLLNTAPNTPITDKQTVRPFAGVTVTEVDQQTLEPVDVLVWLDDAAKGVLQELGGFVDLGGGRYGLTAVTAASATAQLRNLLFVPTENRITVPTTETTVFTVQVTDNKSAPVSDAQSVIAVTAVNDAPVIIGTRSGQTVYAATPIRPFASVTVREVDDETAQPLDITLNVDAPDNGTLSRLGDFVWVSNGVYRAIDLTAEAATLQMRQMEFLVGPNVVAPGAPLLTVLRITVDDRFAEPVADGVTSVLAFNAYLDTAQPDDAALKRSFGFAVDIQADTAVVGAPGTAVNGSDSGSAFVYRLQPGTEDTWEVWRQLQPETVDASDKFGHAVAISGDLIAVGAIQDEVGGLAVGSVYLFQRDVGGDENWGFLTRIDPTNLPAASKFGYAVDLDGDILAVGAPGATLSGASPAPGAVLLFERNAGGADTWGEVMRWSPDGQTSLAFGTAVSVSGDHLVVGAPRNVTGLPPGTPLGAAYGFARDAGGAGTWGFTQRIVVPTVTAEADFGFSVSVAGNVLAVGAPKANLGGTELGQVFIYQKPNGGGAWAEAATLDARADQGGHFGCGVSVNRDFVFVAAPGWGDTNAVYAYLYRHAPQDPAAWHQVERITCPVGAQSLFPPSAAVSFKQDVAIIGVTDNILSPYGYTGVAHMYRFKFNNAPAVAVPVEDQFAEWNEPYAFVIPDTIFVDPDVGDMLTVQPALLTAGHGLALTDMTISGTPSTVGEIPVLVTATDASGAAESDAFNIVVLVDGTLLAATPRVLWNLDRFGKDAANPELEPLVWGGSANPDGDAADNDQEYAFSGNPTMEDAACGVILLTPAADGNMTVSYVRRKDDPSLTYSVQGSAGLSPAEWSDVAVFVLDERTTVIDSAYERVDVTLDVPALGPMMFFRVRVTF